MRLAVQVFLLVVALWSAHLAGVMYVQAKVDTKLLRFAMVRSAFSAFTAALVLVV